MLLALIPVLFVGALAAHAAPTSPPPTTERLSEDAVVDAVLRDHPAVRAAEAREAAARHHTRTTQALPDPTLQVMGAPASLAPAGGAAPGTHDRVGLGLTLRQGLPGRGTRAARAEQAEGAAQAASSGRRATQTQVLAAARAEWVELVRLDHQQALLAAHAALLERLERAAGSRFAQGDAPQSAPLGVRFRRARLQEQRVLLEAARSSSAARLNAWMHRAPASPIAVPTFSEVAPTPDTAPPVAARHPETAAAEGHLRAAAGGVALERARARPNLALIGQYNSMWAAPAHQWMLGVGLDLPLSQRARRARIDAATAQQAAAAASVAAVRDAVDADRHQAEVRVSAQRARLDLYTDQLLPLADARLHALERDYAAGAVPLDAVLEGAAALLDVQQAQADAWADLRRVQIQRDQSRGWVPEGASR